MKRFPILGVLVFLSTPVIAQDAATCAKQFAEYQSEFRGAIMKVMEVREDKKARCDIGRDAMKVLDKMAAAAETCPASAIAEKATDASGQPTMKLLRPGESVKDMVARRKAAFERDCGA